MRQVATIFYRYATNDFVVRNTSSGVEGEGRTVEDALRDMRFKTEAKYADELSTLTLPERKDAF
jgi:hypothetical protein